MKKIYPRKNKKKYFIFLKKYNISPNSYSMGCYDCYLLNDGENIVMEKLPSHPCYGRSMINRDVFYWDSSFLDVEDNFLDRFIYQQQKETIPVSEKQEELIHKIQRRLRDMSGKYITISDIQEILKDAGITLSNATINYYRDKYLKEDEDYSYLNKNMIIYTPAGVKKILSRYEYKRS
jgi:hypothetical protein